ncbi:Gfo/Idh/MocA family protein [Kordiimonas aestuarii]|uniref:Gfo/Idh/MocA family protein n=1 Tax=Kordiimonas aestuarii TaxID=1005925 RepID=UPI0021D3912A|nr:Gfo/Idh/MocA family oxidoreductase [Kordiimonas aestuarii]
MTDKLTVAILGCEHCHIRGNSRLLASLSEAAVVGVWGRDEAYAKSVAAQFDAALWQTPDDIPPIDLALVTSDTRDHAMVLRALDGLASAVHMDKPLGLNSQDARRIATLAEPYADRFAVGFFLRLNPLFIELQARIAAGEIGTLKHLSMTFGHTGRLDGWLDDWPAFDDISRMGYGAFGDLVSHTIDAATLLAGRLTPVTCMLERRAGLSTDVGGAAIATSNSGVLVRFFASAEMQGPRLEVRADGTKGSLWLRGRTLGRYNHEGDPEILASGGWSQASDGPAALIAKLQGKPHAVYATAADGVYVNEVLDSFMAMAG